MSKVDEENYWLSKWHATSCRIHGSLEIMVVISVPEWTVAVQIVGEDSFLNEFRDEFLDNAQYLISEAYCRIHQKIDIGCVSNILLVSLSDTSGIQPPL